MSEAPTMISWAGTRHNAVTPPHSWYSDPALRVAGCNSGILLSPREQHRPYKRDCRNCFPGVNVTDHNCSCHGGTHIPPCSEGAHR